MRKCDAGSGVLFSACLPVAQSLRADADAVTLAPGSCLALVSLCLPVSARCCDAGASAELCQALNVSIFS